MDECTRAPPGLLAFNSSRADGLSSEPSPGSIETVGWQRTSRPQSPAPQPGSTSLPHSFSSGDWWTHYGGHCYGKGGSRVEPAPPVRCRYNAKEGKGMIAGGV